MRSFSCLLLTGMLLTFPATSAGADKEREKAEAKWTDMASKWKATIEVDEKATGTARVVLKFDTVTDKEIMTLKDSPHILAVEAVDASTCTNKSLLTLKSLPNLERLTLNKAKWNVDGFQHFREMKKLTALYMGEAKLTDETFKYLNGLRNLQHLDLYEVPLTDKSIEILKTFTKLQTLNLAGSKITDSGLSQLTVLKDLQEIDLHRTKISLDAMKKFENALPKCRVRR